MTTVTLTTAGSSSWTPPAGLSVIDSVELTGAGGSGGASSTLNGNGSGGTAGEYVKYTNVACTGGVAIPYTIGAGGVAKHGSAGVAGGDTTFGTLAPAHGGPGGAVSNVGNAAAKTIGGTGNTTGAVHHDGGGSAAGSFGNYGSGGGGSGGSAANGNASTSRTGAAAVTGGAAGGNGGQAATAPAAGSAPGAGGGGALNDGTNWASGAGADGQIIITYTPPAGITATAGAATASATAGPVTRATGGTLGLAGAYLDPAVYGTDQAAAVTSWVSKTGRGIGIRASYYGATPADASSDSPLPPPPATSRAAQVVGATCSPLGACPTDVAGAFTYWSPIIGPLEGTKRFYPGSLPASFAGTDVAAIPAGVTPVVCYKTQTTNVTAYVASVTRDIVLVYHQEPEGDYTSGTTFVSEFKAQSNLIRSVGNPHVKVAMNSAHYPYGVSGSDANTGSYIVPASYLDYYFIDVYQHPGSGTWTWPSAGLSNMRSFQNWLTFTAGKGKPLGVAEYGISHESGTTVIDTRLHDDAAYLRTFGASGGPSPFPLYCWLYWQSDCSAGVLNPDTATQNQLKDSTTQATWRGIIAGSI